MLVTPFVAYEAVRFWLPLVTIGGLIIKAYISATKKISTWAERLLTNHLAHIEIATTSTERETKVTNQLLGQVSDQHQTLEKKVDSVFVNMNMHQEKQMHMWDTISKTLVILEDRSSRATRARKK
jgi:hypothetical protein